jgi:hypothetical protein
MRSTDSLRLPERRDLTATTSFGFFSSSPGLRHTNMSSALGWCWNRRGCSILRWILASETCRISIMPFARSLALPRGHIGIRATFNHLQKPSENFTCNSLPVNWFVCGLRRGRCTSARSWPIELRFAALESIYFPYC